MRWQKHRGRPKILRPKAPPTIVSALETVAAVEASKLRFREIFGARSIFDFRLGVGRVCHVLIGDAVCGQAAAFAVSKLGCPYVYGATGPCNAGYDCSGLAQAAWAAAGVSIPRTTYDDWASLPHVSMSSLVPGDLILFDGEGHVAMYVGDGKIVDAPHTGAVVEEISLSESWYAENEDGAVRP